LEGLHLVGCGIKESGMTALAKSFFTLRHLKTLDLRFEDISDEGVGHLAHAVRNAPGLKELRLEGPQIGDEGALALAAALERSSLNRLDLIRTSVTRDGFHALLKTLKGMTTLEVVDLQGHPWTEEAVEVFAEGF
jgi:Ran GTPase-activating protein (RanGAP) involved in mRNA processing and transport